MIFRVNTRANGDQLGDYLSGIGDNDHVEILEVDGREDADHAYLKQTILSMELNAQLTKCKNPYLNVQINPAYGEDRQMSREDWYRAADVLAEELNYTGQRRVITLHTKKGRTHAHVVWERYNHETGKVIPTKNSRLNAKFARARVEKEMGHKRTAWRNDKQEIKEALTDIWNSTKNGDDFVKQAKIAGYIVAAGTGNRPYMVVDSGGISCDLVRQLNGVRTKDVRARLRHEQLITDKEAIELVRAGQVTGNGKRERENPTPKAGNSTGQDFRETAKHTTQQKNEQKIAEERKQRFNEFDKQGQDFVNDKREPKTETANPAQKVAKSFAENKPDAFNEKTEQEQLRETIREQQEKIRNRQKNRGPKR